MFERSSAGFHLFSCCSIDDINDLQGYLTADADVEATIAMRGFQVSMRHVVIWS